MTTQLNRSLIVCVIACLAVVRPAAAQLEFETLQVFDGTNGGYPMGPMVQAADGWVYGVNGGGYLTATGTTVFRFHPQDPTGTFETLWGSVANHTTGYVNDGGLIEAGDGNLYFVAQDAANCGEVGRIYRVTPPSTVTLFYEFCPYPSPMRCQAFGLTVGADGALYGTSSVGGVNGTGGVYRLGLDGTFSVAASFPATFTQFAGNSQLVTGTDGRLYGTQNSPGKFYRVDPASGSVDILHEFGPNNFALGGHGPRGRLLEVPPLPGQDMAFVGVTFAGGLSSYGVIYRIDLNGDVATFAKLYDANPVVGGASGFSAGLARDADGNLYGTTFNGFPAVYRIGSDGTLSILFELGYAEGNTIPSWAPILLADDGNLYGTTFINSAGPPPVQSVGSVFRLKRPSQAPLTVGAPASAIFATSFTVTAAGGSGSGGVTFATSGACGNTSGGALVTMTSGTGICMITATKAGDATYGAATSPPVTVTALKADQTIVFGALANKTLGDPSFTVSATAGASGSPVTFVTTTSTVCTSAGVNGQTITLAAVGTCTVRASQSGDANYNAAPDIEQGFLVQGGVANWADPVKVWLGLKNSDDVGTNFDLQVKLYKSTTPVGSGVVLNQSGGSSGFNNARARMIPITVEPSSTIAAGDTLKVEVLVRIACGVSGHASGTARIWYDGALNATNSTSGGADSRATVGASQTNMFFRMIGSTLSLLNAPGTKTGNANLKVDKTVNSKMACPARPYEAVATWTGVVP